jgi:hypothetical protein
MEGDHSSTCLMLREYKHIIEFLTKQQNSSSEPKFNSMLDRMIKKTTVYLNEALQCDVVVLATILNPAY